MESHNKTLCAVEGIPFPEVVRHNAYIVYLGSVVSSFRKFENTSIRFEIVEYLRLGVEVVNVMRGWRKKRDFRQRFGNKVKLFVIRNCE